MTDIVNVLKESQDSLALQAPSLPVKRTFPWKVWLFLAAAIIPACYAALPYALQVQGISVPPEELPNVLLVPLINGTIYCLLAGLGLFFASRIGLGLPYIEGWLNRSPVEERFHRTVILAAGLGLVASLLILALGIWIYQPLMQAELQALGITIPEEIKPAPWQGFLASFYGGIVEESLLRLCLMSFLAWLGSFLSRDKAGRPSAGVMWTANILAALLFGLGHLPATAAIGLPMSPLIVSRALVLNGIGGLAFGWLYWKRGLESAMIAHFSADIIVHVITPLLAALFTA